ELPKRDFGKSGKKDVLSISNNREQPDQVQCFLLIKGLNYVPFGSGLNGT
ncbi:MAG: hypothetical protein ACI9MB_005282, partial [Verrucomicrobiales bacterium]